MSKPVCVRIAPSPTGDPHVGTAYIALFNYVFAKQHNGRFILRIEDTDQSRAKSSSEEMIYSSLRWLGLDWDEGPDCGGPNGPYRQSERKDLYQEAADNLLQSGHAYRCFCSADRLAAIRKEQRLQGQPPKYDGFCKGLSPEEIEQKLAEEIPSVIRMKIPQEGETRFVDTIRGAVSFENHRIDDQILMKSDGFPTYHLANVVDDHAMGVSHVIRAEEWISSTPKHVLLYQFFGWEEPEWVHLPLLRNADKSKISKRKNPVSLNFYRRAGFLPGAVLNFLALMGWNPGNDQEFFDLPTMQAKLKLADINLGDPTFDLVKLTWMNQRYLQKLSDQDFARLIREEYFSDDYLKKIKPLVIERLNRLDEFVSQNAFFFGGTFKFDDSLIVPKTKSKDELKNVLLDLLEDLDELYDWEKEKIEQIVQFHKDKQGWKPKEFFLPLRIITTGRKDSPPLFDTLEVLGREIVRHRIREYLRG